MVLKVFTNLVDFMILCFKGFHDPKQFTKSQDMDGIFFSGGGGERAIKQI